MLVGIDYGSNLAGTTVVACLDNNEFCFYSSVKKKSADSFLIETLTNLAVTKVFLDAPLSLPAVYANSENYKDYFFRECDRALKCMSPMFLGGLTARAMQLKSKLSAIDFVETYPAFHAKRLGLKNLGYKKSISEIPVVLLTIQREFSIALPKELPNWHYVDALLALLTAVRFEQGLHQVFGNAIEGEIIV